LSKKKKGWFVAVPLTPHLKCPYSWEGTVAGKRMCSHHKNNNKPCEHDSCPIRRTLRWGKPEEEKKGCSVTMFTNNIEYLERMNGKKVVKPEIVNEMLNLLGEVERLHASLPDVTDVETLYCPKCKSEQEMSYDGNYTCQKCGYSFAGNPPEIRAELKAGEEK